MGELFPFNDGDDELSMDLERAAMGYVELPATNKSLKGAYGLALQIDEDGYIMGGLVLRDADSIRGHTANAVIVFTPGNQAVDAVVLPAFCGKLGGVDTREIELYTKGV